MREGQLKSERQLNLFPYYRNLIDSHKKFASIRLGNQTANYKPGQIIDITVGWEETVAVPIAKARIEAVKVSHLADLTFDDLAGESPDCARPDAVKYVLSSIYRTVLHDTDQVTIVRWRYLD